MNGKRKYDFLGSFENNKDTSLYRNNAKNDYNHRIHSYCKT